MLAILRRFKASVTKLHSPCTFFSPRSENCRNPNTCFTHPNAGSTIPLRRRYCRFPRWSFNRFNHPAPRPSALDRPFFLLALPSLRHKPSDLTLL